MSELQRRAFLGFVAGGAAALAAGAVLAPTAVEAAPFPLDMSAALDPVVEEAATTCWWSGGRRICRRRPVRRVCWWRGGRRICAWR
jgi:hypothetical protein